MKTLLKLVVVLSVVTLGGCSSQPAVAHQAEPDQRPSGPQPTLREYVADRPLFLGLMEAAGMMERLDEPNTTLLLPSEESLRSLGEDQLKKLMAEPEQLSATLTDHFLEGAHRMSAMLEAGEVTTDSGLPLVVSTAESGEFMIAGIPVVTSDYACKNGVVHEIDGLLLDLVEEPGEEAPIDVETVPLEEDDRED